uniref:CRM domain-containing protein n=1 Tax=Steinernema glaseri TaxID=37863 RepID=A0A1I8ARI0_9BILA
MTRPEVKVKGTLLAAAARVQGLKLNQLHRLEGSKAARAEAKRLLKHGLVFLSGRILTLRRGPLEGTYLVPNDPAERDAWEPELPTPPPQHRPREVAKKPRSPPEEPSQEPRQEASERVQEASNEAIPTTPKKHSECPCCTCWLKEKEAIPS